MTIMAIGERPPIVHEGWDKAEEYDEIIIRGFFILITPSPEENTKQEHLEMPTSFSHLSGSNLSGSGQNSGSWWMA